MPNANIVLVLDRSYSMVSYNYIQPMKTDANTFLNIMNTSDALGVVSFSTNVKIIFPTNGASQLVPIQGQATKDQAVNAILQNQSHGSTNMKGSVDTGHGMISGSPSPRGIVFLSDGEWNVGGDPLPNLPTDVPIHTIALGPSAGIDTLQQMAYRTCGQGKGYHYAPDAWDLAEIYNQIVQETDVSNVALNSKEELAQYHFKTLPVTIGPGNNEAHFALNWTDMSVTYTPNTPTGKQVNVSLKDPNGNVVTPSDVATNQGYVVFTVQNPLQGIWQMGIWTSGTGPTLKATAGGFEPNSASTLNLSLTTDELKTGKPVSFRADVKHNGQPIKNAVINATVEAPRISFDEALEKHKETLKSINLENEDIGSDGGEMARLRKLHESKLPDSNILMRAQSPLDVKEAESGIYVGEVKNTLVKGPHTVRIEVLGKSPDNQFFKRIARTSFNLD